MSSLEPLQPEDVPVQPEPEDEQDAVSNGDDVDDVHATAISDGTPELLLQLEEFLNAVKASVKSTSPIPEPKNDSDDPTF